MLRILGFALLAASVGILITNGSDEWRTDYEKGQLLGRAAAFVVVSIVAATLGHVLLRRVRGEEASWSRITPEAFAAAGLITFILALFVGPPRTDQQDLLYASADCKQSEPNPVEALPREDFRRVTDTEIALVPGLASFRDSYPRVISYFKAGRGTDRSLVIVWAIGDSSGDHTGLEAGVEQALLSQGFTGSAVDFGGVPAESFSQTGTPWTAIFAHHGCYAFAVVSQSAEAAQARTQVILGVEPSVPEALT